MPKFTAQTINDLFTAERDAGRAARKVEYIVAAEASDGSWCEFDGIDYFHAKTLAANAVDNLNCRGASVWLTCWRTGVKLSRAPLYHIYADEPGSEWCTSGDNSLVTDCKGAACKSHGRCCWQ